jgi:hypothetical protein
MRAEKFQGEAGQARLAAGAARTARPTAWLQSARMTLGHGLVTAGEAIAGCRHEVLDRRAVRPVR